MALKLQELRTDVRNEMMIDKNGRIWTNEVVDEKINNAISKLIGDISHIQKYFEIPLELPEQSTIELFYIHKPCIVTYAAYLLFSMPSDGRNIEKAHFKKVRYEEELRTLLQKIWQT